MVDGTLACSMPCERQIKPGDHQIVVQQEGMEPYTSKLAANRADETTLDLQFSPKPPRIKAWSYAVLSAALWSTGIYLGVAGMDIKDQINRDIANTSKLIHNNNDSRKLKGEWFYIGADVAFGLGAVTALLSLWNFLESGPPSTATVKNVNLAVPEPKKVSLVPFGLPDGAGLSAAGRF